MKKILIILALIVAVAATVWHRAAFAATPTASPTLFCPHINQLQKNHTKGNWTAQTKEGLWKSYDMSFATNITEFVGAQWTGENIGQITCIYNSEQQFTMQGQPAVQSTFPVLLVYHALAFQPSGGKWKHVKQGVYNCYSAKQSVKRSDCPFKINIKPAAGNIFQEAESLKSDTDDSDSLQPPSY